MRKVFIFLSMLLLAISCESALDENSSEEITPDGTGDTESLENAIEISGLVQKGPFVGDGYLDFTLMTENFEYIYNDMYDISSSAGEYTIEIPYQYFDMLEKQDLVIQIGVSGNYFNEMTGGVSTDQVNLKCLVPVDTSGVNEVNINVLTTIATSRITELVAQGYSFENASSQANNETLALFADIEGTKSIENSLEKLDIYGSGENDAILLAASLRLLASSDCSSLIYYIEEEMKTAGIVESESIIEELNNASSVIDVSAVKENLVSFAEQTGTSVSESDIANFEDYIDYDAKATRDNGWLMEDAKNEYSVTAAEQVLPLVIKDGVTYTLDIEYIGEQTDWITITGDATSPITITENSDTSDREAILKFDAGDGVNSSEITVTQKAKGAIVVSKSLIEDISYKGETISVTFDSNLEDVEVYIDSKYSDWISEASVKSMISYSKTFIIAENTTEDKRTGEIVFKADGIADTVTVVQKGNLYLDITTEYKEYSYKATIATVEFDTNTEYEIAPIGVDWLTIIEQLDGKIRFNLLENTTTDSRECTIVFKFSSDTAQYKVTQLAPTFVEFESEVSVAYEGEEFDIEFSSNKEVSLQDFNCNWLELLPSTKGMETTTFTFVAEKNSGITDRSVTLEFLVDGEISEVLVTQEGIESELTFENVEQGTLSTLINEESAQYVTSLALSGMLGYDDCQYIAQMASLTTLDLTGVTFENDIVPDNAFFVTGAATSSYAPLTTLILPEKDVDISEAEMFKITLNLVTLDLGGVTVIPDSEYTYSNSLKYVDLRRVESIGRTAFDDTQIETITIPNSVTNIYGAFTNAANLKSVTFEEGTQLTKLEFVFGGCSSLESIVIPEGIDTLVTCFSNCTSLKEVTLPSTLKAMLTDMYDSGSTVQVTGSTVGTFYNCTSLTSIVIPENIVDLGTNTFAYCTSLSNVEFSGSTPNLTEINGYSYVNYVYKTATWSGPFYGCTALEEITIPASVTSISGSVFAESGLKRLKFESGSQLSSISGGTTSYSNGGLDATSFSKGCFDNVTLEEVDFPETLSSLGNYTFKNCTAESITLNGVKEITTSAFIYSNIPNVSIPNVVTLSGQVFGGSQIETIDLDNVITLGDYVFMDCEAITTVSLAKAMSIGTAAFDGCTSLKTISAPTCAELGQSAFKDCTSLVDLDISNLKIMNGGTFYNCTSLETLDLSQLGTIGSYEFVNCPASRTLTLPNIQLLTANALSGSLVQSITTEKFPATYYMQVDDCPELEEVNLTQSYTVYKPVTFDNCPKLKTATVTGGTTSVYFRYCEALETAEINVGNYSYGFTGCTSLTSVTCSSTSIPSGAFKDCTSLTVTPCQQATTLGEDAFEGCTSLDVIDLPNVTVVEDGAFANLADNVTTINLPKVTTIGSGIFTTKVPGYLTLGTESVISSIAYSSVGSELSAFGNYTGSCNLTIGELYGSDSKISVDEDANTLTINYDKYSFESITVEPLSSVVVPF